MERRALLASVATGTTAALAGCVGGLFGDRVRESREQSFSMDGASRVSVVGKNGDVTVNTHDGDRVAVDATVVAPNQDRLGEVSVFGNVVAEEDALLVGVRGDGDDGRVSVSLDVQVPEGTPLDEAQTANGDVTVEGVAGVAAAWSQNGDVVVRNAGPVQEATTANGDVDVEISPPLQGDARVRSRNGDLTVTLSPDLDVAVDARTTSGDVQLDGLDLQDASVSETHVSGTLGDGTHDLTARTENGDVTLRSQN